MSGWVLELLLRWGPLEEEKVWGMDRVVEEEVFYLRSAESECLREVAVWIWSSGEVALKIPIWKSSAHWRPAAQPTPGRLLACNQGKPPLEAWSCPQVLPGGWRAALMAGQVDISVA